MFPTQRLASVLTIVFLAFAAGSVARAGEAGRGEVYAVVELDFRGPAQNEKDAPARDVDFFVRFRHESGQPTYKIHGFWDGDGRGVAAGSVFKIRFCPTQAGRWTLSEVHSSSRELAGQKQGNYVVATPGSQHGFWIVDADSPGQRWYRRSDGSHQYIVGNTMYSFLSGYGDKGPSGNDIAADIRANAEFFKKLRFGLHGDYYPHPTVKPYLDDDGVPTNRGDYSHRPNPAWFRARVDLAVQTAWQADLIADLILCGPDTEESRSTLRAGSNRGDATPFLRYIAARYGSYPNVWICLANEYEIRTPKFSEEEIARFGQSLRGYLPYPTPLSNHNTPRTLWSSKFDDLPPWHDHQIIQKKLKQLSAAAEAIEQTWLAKNGRPRNKPTVNDELSYQGAGDKHTQEDTIEAHFGAFLGGGYGSTGYKSGPKLGQYFWGRFDAKEHSAADNLAWLRETLDARVTFWKMSPDVSIFAGLSGGFRGLAWPEREYVLGTNKAATGLVAELPAGAWTITQYDVLAKESKELADSARGRFRFDAPEGRAVMFHFRRNNE